jgi:hypothetical protein
MNGICPPNRDRDATLHPTNPFAAFGFSLSQKIRFRALNSVVSDAQG